MKKALDTGPVRPMLIRKAGGPVRAIGWPDLFYLYAVKSLREELTPKARTEFYEALQQTAVEREGEVRFGRFRIAVRDLVREMASRTTELSKLAGKVSFRADGEALIKHTNIEVYRIAALIEGGLSVDEVMAGYPSLMRGAVEMAKAYADAYPKPGRPYPRTTAKRALQGAGLEALDEVLGDGDDPA
ncbi:MAG: DUF433 domain-containing protein [Hyphomicrobiales bacterium]